jgi:hypothetical protein
LGSKIFATSLVVFRSKTYDIKNPAWNNKKIRWRSILKKIGIIDYKNIKENLSEKF